MLRKTRQAVAHTCAAVAIGIAAVGWGDVEVANAVAPPDGRAYELVSPATKSGGEVMGDSGRTRAAAAETLSRPMAASFASLTGFGDVRGTGIATEYISQRDGRPGTSGWSTHAITPPQAPLSVLGAVLGQDPLYTGEFSSDLSSGAFRAWSPLTSAPNVQHVENLYMRNDLRTPGAGVYTLLSNATSLLPPSVDKPLLAGESADFSHVIFESSSNLTSDATGFATKLYESHGSVVQLVGILPDGTLAASSFAGQGATNVQYTTHTISTDGSRVFFTDPSTGHGLDGTLYLREINTGVTAQLNASERTDCAGDPACGGDGLPNPAPDPGGPQAAMFQTATSDGARMFFTTTEQLTDDDDNGVVDLYMYDAIAPAGQHLTRLSVDKEPADPANSVLGVIGASDDGRYVYFIATGQLVAGKPTLLSDRGIYVWHEGEGVSYIGQLTDTGDTIVDLNTNWGLTPLQARVTPDGRHMLLASHSGVGLTGYDHNTTGCGQSSLVACNELYVYSADGHDLACASCNPSGAAAVADADDNAFFGTGGSLTSWHLSHAISDDGNKVFFSTREALVPADTNGKVDAYEYDVPTAAANLLSSGQDTSDSHFMDASADGRDVFILTREQLVRWDTDRSYDLYDVRVHGGFPDPTPVPAECSGDVCQGALATPPGAEIADSAVFSGVGDVNSSPRKARPKLKPKPLRCKKGFTRKKLRGKVRCFKQKKHASRSIKKATATTSRRAK